MGIIKKGKAIYPIRVSNESIKSAFYKLIPLVLVYPSKNVSIEAKILQIT
jgi:hypothetical protein